MNNLPPARFCQSPVPLPAATRPDPSATAAASIAAGDSCVVCGQARQAGAKFCPQCGLSLTVPTAPPLSSGPAAPLPGRAVIRSQIDAQRMPQSVASPVAEPSWPVAPPIDPVAPPPSVYQPSAGPAANTADPYGAISGNPSPNGHGPVAGMQLLCQSSSGRQWSAAIPVGAVAFYIGKSRDCDLSIVDDPYISRCHAAIDLQPDGSALLQDAGSSNGTFLRVRRPIELRDGDEIVIGTTVLRVQQQTH